MDMTLLTCLYCDVDNTMRGLTKAMMDLVAMAVAPEVFSKRLLGVG